MSKILSDVNHWIYVWNQCKFEFKICIHWRTVIFTFSTQKQHFGCQKWFAYIAHHSTSNSKYPETKTNQIAPPCSGKIILLQIAPYSNTVCQNSNSLTAGIINIVLHCWFAQHAFLPKINWNWPQVAAPSARQSQSHTSGFRETQERN